MTPEDPNQNEGDLCRSCGLCCDGTLFSNSSDAETGNGSPKETTTDEPPQPCIHLSCEEGCKIYGIRPYACFAFRCSLLNRLHSGSLSLSGALRTVDLTKRQRDEVLAKIGAKASFLKPTPLPVKFEQVFVKGRSASAKNLKEDAEAFMSLGLLQHLIKKHFLKKQDPE